MLHPETNPGGNAKPRRYFYTDFTPSATCLDRMETVAEGIVGIIGVSDTSMEGATFYLVFEPGVDDIATSWSFLSAFMESVDRLPEVERDTLKATVAPKLDVRDAMAVSSDGRDIIDA